MTDQQIAKELVAYFQQYASQPEDAIYRSKLIKLWRMCGQSGSRARAYAMAVKEIEGIQ